MGLVDVWNSPEGRYGIVYSMVCFTPILLAVALWVRTNYRSID